MKSLLQALAREFAPPILRRIANSLVQRGVHYVGPYADWREAEGASEGYDQASILERVRDSTKAVLDGKGTYEQDGVLFHDNPPPPSSALIGLLIAASRKSGRLCVLDFGGGLGSHYLRWKPLLAPIGQISWQVVEQAHFVVAGRQLFSRTEHPVDFHCWNDRGSVKPHAVLASSVLQYIPTPYDALRGLADQDPHVIVIDRTPFSRSGNGHVLVQRVTRPLHPASYPLATLSRRNVEEALSGNYTLLQRFPSPDSPIRIRGAEADYGGEIWIRKG